MAEESDEQGKVKVIVFILAIALISGLIIWCWWHVIATYGTTQKNSSRN